MKVFLTNTFRRQAKKLHRNQVKLLEDALKKIQDEPDLGDMKVGDLAGIQVYKFHLHHQLILLAYTYESEADRLTFLSFAPHENFYADLKRNLLKD